MQDGKNVENVAHLNQTPKNDESQPIVQQEDTASTSETAEKNAQHRTPKKGEAKAAPKKRKKRCRDKDARLISYHQEGVLLRALGRGESMRSAAARAGCHPGTVSRMMQQDEDFANRVLSAQDDLMANLIIKLSCEAGRDWRAGLKLLEFLDKRSQRMQAKERSPSTQA